MTRTLWIATATALVLAGCSRQPSGPAPEASPTPTPTPAAGGAIPSKLQGRYALAPADCRPAHGGDVRGLLTIGGQAIAFGVAPVPIDRIALRADRAIFDATEVADGVRAKRSYDFRIAPGGDQLTRLEAGLPDRVYTRCPKDPN